MDREAEHRALFAKLSQEREFIIGADECGTGAWAGPLLTCAVAVPRGWVPPPGVNDSKQVSAKSRSMLFDILRAKVPYVCEMGPALEIDREGLRPTLRRCFLACLTKLKERFPDSVVLLDGDMMVPGIDHLVFPRADEDIPAVSAASIIGKAIRDRYMTEMGVKYPGYKFGVNMGYGGNEKHAHTMAIKAKGLSPIHRRSYAPNGVKLKTFDQMKAAEDDGLTVED